MPLRVESGLAGRSLDAVFAAEGLGIVGPIARDVGLGAEAISLSGLQVLYWLRSQHPLTRPDMLRAMAQWRGTGRNDVIPFKPSGAVPELLDRMVKDELLWEMGSPKRLLVSPKGIALLSRLHPASEDLDLPSRLARWQSEWPASERDPGKYVRSFIARQRNFISS